MPTVELVFERGCPNVQSTRVRLAEAFRAAGLPPAWTEWEVGDPAAPAHARAYGSPTILIDGRDIAGLAPGEARGSCRIYSHVGDGRGTPPMDLVLAALSPRGRISGARGAARLNAATIPSVGVALLPKLTCAACWPAYAGLTSSLGFGFFDYTPHLLHLTAVFLSISLAALAYRAATRHGFGPLLLGTGAAVAVLAGKFGLDSDPATYAGLGTLVIASVWNTWPRRRRVASVAASCPSCTVAPASPPP